MSASAAQPQDGNQECGFKFRTCSGPNAALWWCVDCSARICDDCWPLVPGHRDGATARDGQPHEKTDSRRHDRLRKILNPPVTEDELERLHEADVETTWFGIRENRYGYPYLTDGGIYNSLIAQCPRQDGTKYPQLVSFIGQTNAGKSTLIKMLIDLAEARSNLNSQPPCATPVVGSSIHSRLPTSADVHLYADPRTYSSQTPVFYADAEGLDAGEARPIGAASRRKSKSRGIRGGSKRLLDWADTPERRERPFIVSELYPRLLYTFSDVVVFVLRNEKTFEKTGLERLIKWGAASLETSVNQPTLPQLVIAVNAATLNVATQLEWDVRYATESLLQSARSSLYKKTYFSNLARSWRSKGQPIDSIDDLIRCYYSSFSVVRIPAEGRYALLDKQIEALGETITSCCNGSFNAKRRANMLSNSDEFSMFLHSGFDHFTLDLQTPFNFIEVSLRNNPIPQDFGGHILQLAISLHKLDPEEEGHWIFEALSKFVASSVLLDCVRHRKGLPLDHMADYEDYFDYALEEYCKFHSLCTFENERGRCINTRSTHESKGHQNFKGRIIGAGPYQSDFTFDKYYNIWADMLDQDILRCQNKLEELRDQADRTVSDESHALKLHRREMDSFYRARGTAKEFRSHTVCFSCLMGIPQHSLPCGHVLCTPCVKGFGKPINRSDFSLISCPLHYDECSWNDACDIRFKPDLAGVRVLSLDGGGIRGIVELEVLRAVQKAVGDRIPIRAFFDLIVGTSTGGIIALAIGRNWTINKCIDEFQKLCHQAFTPRALHGIPVLQRLETLNHGSIYKTKQLHEALGKALGRRSLFGGRREDDTNYTPKVAVTSTDEEGRRAVVIANYNRSGVKSRGKKGAKGQYVFPRPDDPSLELTYWEAAAATAAAPPYFKSFYHKATRRSYLDGAFYNNNPARIAQQERKMLWPDVADRHPDIFLSIGTSKDARQLKREMRNLRDDPKTRSRRPIIPFPRWNQLFNAMHGRMDSILDAETSWKDFVEDNLDVTTEENDYRYVRINPNIGSKPPDLDAVDQLQSLRDATKTALKEEKSTIQHVARSLISSSFYFDMTTPPNAEGATGFKCKGKILCRLERYVRALGDYLLLQQRPGFQPYFQISEDDYHAPKQQLELSEEIINRMTQQGAFDMNSFDITLSSRTTRVHVVLFLVPSGSTSGEPLPYPISGFPRTLASEASSGWVPPSPTGTGILTQKTQNKRRRDRRMRASTGGISPQSVPRPEPSRAFSLPEQSRNDLTGERNRALTAEPQAPPGPVHQVPPSSLGKDNILPEITGRSSNPKVRDKVATQPTMKRELTARAEPNERPQEHLPRAQTSTPNYTAPRSIAHGKRPVVNDSWSSSSNRSELPADSVRREHVSREEQQTFLQPPLPASSSRFRDSTARLLATPTSGSGDYPDSSTMRAELRALRRMKSTILPGPEVRVAQNRAVELPASTRRHSSSHQVVRERGPLAELERRLDPQRQRQRPAFYGYASEEDVSHLGSTLD